MKKIRCISSVIFLSALIALISGCVNPMKTVHDADYNVTQTQDKLQRIQNRSTSPAPAVVKYSGYYVNPNPVTPSQGPIWMNNQITLRAQNVPMSFLTSRILRDTDASVSYQNGANQNQLLSMDYSGDIKGALNQIAADTNYAYSVQNNVVTWNSYVTKTFNISFMPGTSSYQVGQNKGLGAGEAANANSSGTNTVSTVTGDLGAQQYSNLTGSLSVWNDLSTTLNQLKSADGTVSISESTTTVTVHDHPSNVQAMTDYINQLNRDLSREVAIQVEVLEVDLNKEFNYGINWNTIWQIAGTQVGIAGNLAGAASTPAIATQSLGTAGIATLRLGNPNASNALIQALSQQGRVSVVTQPRVVTMNNQMAEIKITRDVAYLQSVSNTTTANAGNASNTQTLTPGVVTDGFTLYLLPKIQKNRVYLQISSALSNLTAINTVSNNGTVNQPIPTTTATAGTTAQQQSVPFQAIQVPTLANKMFNQRTVIDSGSTLMITGFQQVRNQTQRSQLFGIKPLGGTGAERRNVQTIVLITPTVLGKY